MSISEIVTTAVKETCLPRECKACERKGLPILLLRKALVPDIAATSHQKLGDTYPLITKPGLRTLREGYLYVLLDQKYWQAYEITEQGYLRRFNPYQCSPGSPAPLPTRCMHKDHDLPSSFLTVDTAHYSTAWLAFSDDPWTASVLDAYKDGRAPAERFQSIDLKAAREDPASIGLAVTHKRQTISHQVFEYAEHDPGVMVSAHPFHSRRSRIHALLRYIEAAERQHKLKNGLLAYVLEDPLGMIQESNAQRLSWVARRQEWREDPEVAYPLLTSQCLLAIRAANRTWAEQQAKPALEQMTGNGPPPSSTPEEKRQRGINSEEADKNGRLEQRYDEKRRAKFQANYERVDKRYQAAIDFFTAQYALFFDSRDFGNIERYDYDNTDERSRLDYVKTMTRCLRGGVTEAPHAQNEPLGPSENLWLKWLEDPNSPAYRTLFVRDKNLLDGLIPSFSATEDTDWKDGVKLYAAVTAIIGSKEGELWVRAPLRKSVAELLGAVNTAAARLEYRLGAGAQRAVMHLNVAGQSLHNGVQLFELKMRMTLGEYYAIQSAQVRQLQNTASEALAKVRNVRAPIKVRPVILGGVLSLAVLDPKLASKIIDIRVWVSGSAEELHGSLKAGVKDLAGYTKAGLTNIVVVNGALTAHTRELLNSVRINATQVAGLLRDSLFGLRGAATSSALLLGVGSIYLLHDMLKKNLIAVETEVGSKANEATWALHGTMMALLGGHIEVAGKILEKSGERLAGLGFQSAAGRARFGTVSELGKRMARFGAMISATVGLFDACVALFAAKRVYANGDLRSVALYGFSGIFAIAGVVAGIVAVIVSGAFFGALGVAVGFGLSAFALLKAGEWNESTPLERWARRCYFGLANESPSVHWNEAAYADIALAELNAATLGVDARLSLSRMTSFEGPIPSLTIPNYKTTVRFLFSLPRFESNSGAYHWQVMAYRRKDVRKGDLTGGQLIGSAGHNAELLAHTTETKPYEALYGDKNNSETTSQNVNSQQALVGEHTQVTNGVIKGVFQHTTTSSSDNFDAIKFSLTYWPDKDIESSFAQITITEQA